jgi:hypothetical protein
LGAFDTVTVVEQVMVGGCVSRTLTLKSHAAPEADVQVTTVVPTGNNEPADGEQVTVPQSPLEVGAG